MEFITQELVYFFQVLIRFAWLPVVIWTLCAGGVLLLLKAAPKVHPQYHYHIRLALILGLPFGLTFAWLADKAALYFSEPAALTFISVVSPIEVGINSAPADSFSVTDGFFLVCGLLLAGGFIWYAASRLTQWVRLRYLRQTLQLVPINDHPGVSPSNKKLADEISKPIYMATSDQDYIPVTFGVMKPVILVPESLTAAPQKMNLAVRHELTHIQQSDFGTHLLVTAIQAVFWFHPLIHILSSQIVEYREMRCDSLIIAVSSVSRKEYASLLFELLPMPNLNQKVSVNMAQSSSNLKERIDRITRQSANQVYPYRSSLTMLTTLLVALAIGMACTDMQTQAVFDNEELDLMTDVDRTGERGYHQIIIYMGEDGQTERHEGAINKLSDLRPEYIKSINVLKGAAATEKYGDRAQHGVIEIRTEQDPESYNTALNVLGMEPEMPPMPASGESNAAEEDFFVVVEEMPELIGGLASIQRTVQYPEIARRAGIEGRVYIQFIVNKNGDVENPRVIRGIGGGADEAALDAVRQAKFKPGVQRGRPVRVQYSLPIVFRLSNSEGGESVKGEQPEVQRKPMSINFQRNGSTIQGTITDDDTGEPLAGANIIIEGTNSGTVSDRNGEFSIFHQAGESTNLMVTYVGYGTVSADINPERDN